MAPSIEFYEDIAKILPVKPLPTKINGVSAVSTLQLEEADKHDLVLKYFRAYIADLCEQFGGGHPGSAMGMAAIGVALYKYVMKFSPRNCNYFNRDRFVLSNGMAPHFPSIGNAKIAGMAKDLQLTSNDYSVAAVVFFTRSNMLLVRSRPSIFLPAIMIIWGTLTCVMAAAKHYQHLVVLRVFVGIIECGFAPGIILIPSSWYKREEQSKCFAVFMSAAILSGAFGGLIASAITGGLKDAHGLRGWRWLFIVEGAATIDWAAISYFILLDFPANSRRLTQRERDIAVASLREGGVSVRTGEGVGKTRSFLLALRDWRTWGFILGYMVIVGFDTILLYPTLVNGLEFKSTVQAQYMTVPIYAYAFVCTAIIGIFADRNSQYRGLVIAGWLSFPLITSICVCLVYNFTAPYVLLVLMAAGLWASNSTSLSFASSTFGSMELEVRAIAIALANAMGNLAQIYGAYLFPTEDAPKYFLGFGREIQNRQKKR